LSPPASIARKVYLQSGVGIGGLSRVYGGLAKRGTRKSHFGRASRGVVRSCLKQLEEMKLIGKKKNHTGRFITSQGQKTLDTIAKQIADKLPRPAFYDMKAPEMQELADEKVEEEEVEDADEQ
jgi:ribosomal protein S19E (S16A)